MGALYRPQKVKGHSQDKTLERKLRPWKIQVSQYACVRQQNRKRKLLGFDKSHERYFAYSNYLKNLLVNNCFSR